MMMRLQTVGYTGEFIDLGLAQFVTEMSLVIQKLLVSVWKVRVNKPQNDEVTDKKTKHFCLIFTFFKAILLVGLK